jgi:type II secretory pathway component PulJ
MKIKKTGFTLVETLLYFGLFSILLFVLARLFVSILQVKAESESVSSVQQDSRYILARLEYDFAQASSVTTPATLGTSGSTLVLQINGVANTYSLVNSKLQVVNNQGTFIMNSSESQASNLTFKRLGHAGGKPTIKIQVSVESKTVTDKGRETRIISTTLGIR